MILLSEPEAASYFTVRHLQENGVEILKVSHSVHSAYYRWIWKHKR